MKRWWRGRATRDADAERAIRLVVLAYPDRRWHLYDLTQVAHVSARYAARFFDTALERGWVVDSWGDEQPSRRAYSLTPQGLNAMRGWSR